MALPKYWILKWENSNKFKEFIKWINKEYNKGYSGITTSKNNWYGYDGSEKVFSGDMSFGVHCYENTRLFINNPVVFNSAKEFFEALNEEEFVLPKKWAISAYGDEAKLSIIDKWFSMNVREDICSDTRAFFHFPELEKGKICTDIYRHKDYKEINFLTFKKYVLKEQEEKIYTIEDLAEGRVQLENDGKYGELLRNILTKAFPNDYSLLGGDGKYYFKSAGARKQWWFNNIPKENIPIQHISKFKLIEENTKEMNYTISKAQLRKIHNIACNTWKAKIKAYASQDPFADNITFSEKQVKEMFDAAQDHQLPTLKSIFKDYKKEETLDDIKGGRDHFRIGIPMIDIRQQEEYAHKAYFLNSDFNWEIKKDSKGLNVLIPTKK